MRLNKFIDEYWAGTIETISDLAKLVALDVIEYHIDYEDAEKLFEEWNNSWTKNSSTE